MKIPIKIIVISLLYIYHISSLYISYIYIPLTLGTLIFWGSVNITCVYQQQQVKSWLWTETLKLTPRNPEALTHWCCSHFSWPHVIDNYFLLEIFCLFSFISSGMTMLIAHQHLVWYTMQQHDTVIQNHHIEWCSSGDSVDSATPFSQALIFFALTHLISLAQLCVSFVSNSCRQSCSTGLSDPLIGFGAQAIPFSIFSLQPIKAPECPGKPGAC